jgi:hypothetical protein
MTRPYRFSALEYFYVSTSLYQKTPVVLVYFGQPLSKCSSAGGALSENLPSFVLVCFCRLISMCNTVPQSVRLRIFN